MDAVTSYVPLFIILVPMLTGIIAFFFSEEKMLIRKVLIFTASIFSLAGVLWLFRFVLDSFICCDLVDYLQFGLSLKVDLISWIFAAIIVFIWFMATIYSFTYMEMEHNLRRYYSFFIFTLGAILGVVFAGDFLTLFIFFEIMTFSSFVLVIHKQDREAMQAGSLYLYLAIAGGLSLLFAIMMVYGNTGTLEIIPMLAELGNQRTAIFVLFMIGFGIKAGLVPLHIWLPLAHPVAPSPASALLSGIMIKAGVYGIVRVSMVLYHPVGDYQASVFSLYLFNTGYIFMWIGIVSMLAGAVMALLQNNAKRILAYSSISQVGFIATGIGVAIILGTDGGMGFSGALYHVLNHAVYKAGLFMMIGAVYLVTHEVNLQNLGGFFKKAPVVGVTFLIGALGIAGLPGFNGYASKTLIHDALLEAYKLLGLQSFYIAERLFLIASALTICYFIKLFSGVFLGPEKSDHKPSIRVPFSVNIVLSGFALTIILIGLFPNYLLDKIIIPAAALIGFSGQGMEHMAHFNFFEWHPLQAVLVVVILALFIYIPGVSKGWFDWVPPKWFSIQYLVLQPLPRFFLSFFFRDISINDMAVGQFYEREETEKIQSRYNVGDFDHIPNDALDEAGQKSYLMIPKLIERERDFREQFKTSFIWDQEQWNIKNLNFDNLLLAFVLGVVLFIVFYYSR